MTPLNYLAAPTFVPICLAGAPLEVVVASYFGTSSMSRAVSRNLRRSELLIASRSCTARAVQGEPEG